MILRNFKKSVFIIIIQTSLIFFLTILVGNINTVQNSLSDRNSIHSENYMELSFKNFNDIKPFMDILMKEPQISIKYYLMDIFETQTNDTSNILGLYMNSDFNSNLELKSGRLLNQEDMNSTSKLAVIGENIESNIYKEKGKQFIISGNDKFEVVGVLKETKGFTNSDLILYNLKSIMEQPQKLSTHNWIIDSDRLNAQEIYSILHDISSKYNYQVDINPNDGARYSSNNYIFIKFSMILAFLLTSLSIFIALIRSIILWFNDMLFEIGVRLCCGANNIQLLKLIVYRYFTTTIISIIATSILIQIVSLININFIYFKFNFDIIVKIILINLFIFIISSIILMYKLKKTTINTLLKGRS